MTQPSTRSGDVLRIATRGSKLALWQAEFVRTQLADLGLDSELVVIKTKGDRVQDRFLHEMGGKGVFVRELERALLDGDADLAVHSLKDLPVACPEGLELAAVLPRHAVGDVFVWAQGEGAGHPSLSHAELMRMGQDGAVAATGSLRRGHLLAACGWKVVPIRGNVDTRLDKLRASEDWTGLVLAAASFERLGAPSDLHVSVIDPDYFTPSPSQGALVIEARVGSAEAKLAAKLACAETTQQVALERGVLAALGGDCTLPIGVHVAGDRLDAVVLDGSAEARVSVTLERSTRVEAGVEEAVQALLKVGLNARLAALGLGRGETLMRTIIWTRAAEDWPSDEALIAQLRVDAAVPAGVKVVSVPMVSYRACEGGEPPRGFMEGLGPLRVVFTSARTPDYAQRHALLASLDDPARSCAFWAVGSETARALAQAYARAQTIEQPARARGAAELAEALAGLPEGRFILPGPRQRAGQLAERLEEAGHRVWAPVVYETEALCEELDVSALGVSEEELATALVCVAAPSAVDAFVARLAGRSVARMRVLCIGVTTYRRAREQGLPAAAIDQPGLANLAAAALSMAGDL